MPIEIISGTRVSSVIEEAKGWYVRPEYPVLFLHGIGSGSAELEPHAQHFREKGVTATSVQIPPYSRGHFDFSHVADWCREKVDEMGTGKVAIVGQSLGGLVALKFAAAYPDQAAFLVINSSPCGADREAKQWLVTMLQMLKLLPPQTIKSGLAVLGSVPGVVINELPFLLRNNNPQELIECYLGHTRHDWREDIRTIPASVPIIFRVADGDQWMNRAGYRAIYEAKKVVVLEDPDGDHGMPGLEFVWAMAVMAASKL